MAKEYHFVVVYNTETKEFTVDGETLSSNFYNGEVWDEQAGEWFGFRNTEELETDYIQTEDKLAEILSKQESS